MNSPWAHPVEVKKPEPAATVVRPLVRAKRIETPPPLTAVPVDETAANGPGTTWRNVTRTIAATSCVLCLIGVTLAASASTDLIWLFLFIVCLGVCSATWLPRQKLVAAVVFVPLATWVTWCMATVEQVDRFVLDGWQYRTVRSPWTQKRLTETRTKTIDGFDYELRTTFQNGEWASTDAALTKGSILAELPQDRKSTKAHGPMSESLKRHGKWEFTDVDWTSVDAADWNDLTVTLWYWYGEEVTEGEWALRSKK